MLRAFSNRWFPVATAVTILAILVMAASAIRAQDPSNDCPDCDLQGKNFAEQSLVGVNLSGANLYKASFAKADLSNAILTMANLTGADFTDACLLNADLSGADLTDAIGLKVADTGNVQTDASTTCPDGTAGPCDFSPGS